MPKRPPAALRLRLEVKGVVVAVEAVEAAVVAEAEGAGSSCTLLHPAPRT